MSQVKACRPGVESAAEEEVEGVEDDGVVTAGDASHGCTTDVL
jgi:hypothetical protein